MSEELAIVPTPPTEAPAHAGLEHPNMLRDVIETMVLVAIAFLVINALIGRFRIEQGEYARLFGILPIGVLGLVGYIAILITWLIARSRSNPISNLASLAILVMTTAGTFFSIYLTFLEPFVIGATCAWCLTSAILMTVLMLLSVRPAKLAISKISFSSSHPRKRK